MNRRYFLGAAVALAGTRRAAVAASDRVNVAIVGVGGRGRHLLQSYGKINGVNVKYICDADKASLEKAQAIALKIGIPKPAEVIDMRRLLEDKGVGAVVVTTPDHWHAPAAILAADAGKDVYVEKPASHNIREGRLMIDAARRNNRIMQVGTQPRFDDPGGRTRQVRKDRQGLNGESLEHPTARRHRAQGRRAGSGGCRL